MLPPFGMWRGRSVPVQVVPLGCDRGDFVVADVVLKRPFHKEHFDLISGALRRKRLANPDVNLHLNSNCSRCMYCLVILGLFLARRQSCCTQSTA